MRFLWPFVLWSLVLVPAAAVAYGVIQARQAAAARRFASAHMMANVAPDQPGWRRHVPMALYLLAMLALLIGLARPQASFAVPRERATVMLVMDESISMDATDVEPNRLEAAKAAAGIFLDQLPSPFQVGVVGFSKTADILNRPTTDRVAVRRALDGLETKGGTAIGDGIFRSLQAGVRAGDAPRRDPMVLLMLSDGNNTTGRIAPDVATRQARRLDVPIYTVALGDEGRSSTTPTGRPVKPPNYDLLREIADTTGGRFFTALSSERLEEIYRRLGSSISVVREDREVTVAFVGAGFVLLLVGAALSSWWFKRVP